MTKRKPEPCTVCVVQPMCMDICYEAWKMFSNRELLEEKSIEVLYRACIDRKNKRP